MDYLIENMEQTKLKDTRITQATRFASAMLFSLALAEGLKTLESATIEGSAPVEELNMLKEVILLTIEHGPFTPAEA